jgi:hypothetical protein
MSIRILPKTLLTSSAIVMALSAPVFAQTDNRVESQSGMDQMQEPAAAQQETGQAPASEVGSETPMLKNTLTDKPVDPLKTERTAEGAAGTMDEALPTEPILTAQKAGQMVSDEIIGMDVRNSTDDSIGTIDALVIDSDNRVVAGIVSVGGFLGIGAKEVAVNWMEFSFQPEEEIAFVDLSREQLENAPKFREREDVQAQLEIEQQRRDVERQQDRFEDQAEPAGNIETAQ